jgi:hypothetical protein
MLFTVEEVLGASRKSETVSNGTPLRLPTTGPLRRLTGVAQSLKTIIFFKLFPPLLTSPRQRTSPWAGHPKGLDGIEWARAWMLSVR